MLGRLEGGGEDPTGSATPFEHCHIDRGAAPWEEDVAKSRHFPQRLREVVEAARDRAGPRLDRKVHCYHAGLRVLPRGLHPVPLLPETTWSLRRQREGRLELIPAIEALFAGPGKLSRFEPHRQDTSRVREIMVCTHGSRDACCGKFGYPFYGTLRYQYAFPEGLRVWRASHIGGHRFAPTLMDLPEGRYWGHLEPEAVENLVLRNGPASDLKRFYRGWAGLGTEFEQIAEHEILAREGWGWTKHPKIGRVLKEDGDRVEVRIDYEYTDGAFGAYEATVQQSGSVATLESSGTAPLSEAEQYEVSRLEKAL